MKQVVNNKKILFETHLHTAEVSPCAYIPYKDIPDVYINAGYGGIIVTNHYTAWALDYLPPSGLDGKIDFYFLFAHELREEGERKGLKVLIGAEVTVIDNGGGRDFLIYGEIEKPFKTYRRVYDFSAADLYKFCIDNNLLMFHAHPLRTGYAPMHDFKNLHGLEVFNTANNCVGDCARASAICGEHGLMRIAGSDFHKCGHEGRAGIYLPEQYCTDGGFVNYYRSNTPELYIKE